MDTLWCSCDSPRDPWCSLSIDGDDQSLLAQEGRKQVFITGGNSGIGLALCERLAAESCCHVYMGSRCLDKGNAALASIVEAHPDAVRNIEVVQCDVSDPSSVTAAADVIKKKGLTRNQYLYGLVNNAGTDTNDSDALLKTNFYGPKLVSDAFMELLDPVDGRIVNVSCGAASRWLYNQVM